MSMKARVASLWFVCRHTTPQPLASHRPPHCMARTARASRLTTATHASSPAPQAKPAGAHGTGANFLHNWAVSGPFCACAGKGDGARFSYFPETDDDGLKMRRCDASHLLIDLQTPLGAPGAGAPAAGAACRLTRPAPSHRTCARPSVAWSRCAARVAPFSRGADGSSVPSDTSVRPLRAC